MDEKFKKAYGIYDGIDTSIFKHIPEISFYNNNYYIGLRRENDVNNEKRMTVQELIDELMKVPDKSAEVFYLSDSGDFFNNLKVYSMGKIYGDD